MSRARGTLFTSSNFEPIVKAPLDARQKVQGYGDLTDPSTWKDFNGNVWLYKGTLVVVTEDPSSGLYWLNDPDNYTVSTSWTQVMAPPVGDVSVGVLNVGDGSAGSFAGYDSSGNMLLRTFTGSGGAVVSEVGDVIYIGIDASYSGETNYGTNVGTGDASIYVGKAGDALEFREIKGEGSITISSSDNLVLIGGGSGSYDTTLDPSLVMPSTVGGIPAGTTVDDLKGDTLISMWDDLLFPTSDPVLTAPSGSFVMGPATTLYEIDDTASLTFTTTLNRGSINPQYNADSPYRSGLPNNFNFMGTGLIDASSSAIPYVHAPIDVSILIGNQSWSAQIGYDGGVQPFDNKGNPYDASLAAGTLSASPTRTIEGVYPIYATISDIADPDEKLTPLTYSMLTGNNINISLPAESGGNKQSFDIADAWLGAPTNRPLQGVEQYDSNFDVWNALNMSSFTITSVTHSVGYKRYTYNGATIGARLIRLKF